MPVRAGPGVRVWAQKKCASALPRRWICGTLYLQAALSVLPRPGEWCPAGQIYHNAPALMLSTWGHYLGNFPPLGQDGHEFVQQGLDVVEAIGHVVNLHVVFVEVLCKALAVLNRRRMSRSPVSARILLMILW